VHSRSEVRNNNRKHHKPRGFISRETLEKRVRADQEMKPRRLTNMSKRPAIERQIRGQRISDEELIAESQEILRRGGIQNYARAEFVNLLSKVVVGNPAPILCQLQPRTRSKASSSWIYAWDLVSSFIASNSLPLTLDTMNTELEETKETLRLTLKSSRNANDEFNQLLYSSETGPSDSESLIRRNRRIKQDIPVGDPDSSEDSDAPSPIRSRRAIPKADPPQTGRGKKPIGKSVSPSVSRTGTAEAGRSQATKAKSPDAAGNVSSRSGAKRV
jgi:hypothetical protein